MAFDAIVTRAVTRELSGYMTGGKVEKIYQPGDDELVFFIYGSKGRVKIYASSNSNHPGIFPLSSCGEKGRHSKSGHSDR